MAKSSPIYKSFNAGEWGGLLEGRVDIDQYRNAMKLCENGVPLVQGPWTNRPGTKFVAEAGSTGGAFPRLERFVFSNTQAYILEFGPFYMRVFMDRGQVLSGGSPYELVTPYGSTYNLQFVQSNDAIFIFSGTEAPRKLTRTGHAAWTLTQLAFTDGPYLPINTTTTTLTPSATTGAGITITASSTTGINDNTGFLTARDVGRYIRIQSGAPLTWGWAKITSVTSSTAVVADVVSNFGAITASLDWRLTVWDKLGGFPTCGTFHEDRLVLANWVGSSDSTIPQRIDGSVPGEYENFSPSDPDGTVSAGHAYSFSLNSNDANPIQWILSGEKGMYAGTQGGEWIVRPSILQEALSATNVSAKQSTRYGSWTPQQPVQVGDSTLFIQKSGRKLRDFRYVYEVDGFKSIDRSMLNPSITQTGLTQLAYQRNPHSIVWARRTDGKLIGLTYELDEGVVAWHRHTLGGYSDAGRTAEPEVGSIACIPEPNGAYDDLWLAVKRYINGSVVFYIEYLTPFWEEGNQQADAFYVDCGLTYSGAAATTISGLDHLEGETVAILADGAVHPQRTVSGGAITLQSAATKVQVGLPYTAKGQTLRAEAGAADGTAQGKTKRWSRVVMRFLETLGIKVGPNADNTTRITFRTSSDPTNAPPPLFTGDKEVPWESGYDMDGYIYWEQDQPLPATILCITGQITTQDR